LAAFGVFLHHLNKLSFGPLGVTFFFVLSGFILTYSYYNKSTGIIKFYLARIGRIYPVAILTFLISIPLVFHEYSQNIFTFIGKAGFQLFLLQSYVPDSHIYYSFNGVAWSISTEMFFYLMFPFILKQLQKRKESWFFATLFAVVVLIEFAIGWILQNDIQGLNTVYWLFYISPFFRILDFLSGCCIAFLFLLKPVNVKGATLWEVITVTLLIWVYVNVSHVPGSMGFGIIFVPFVGIMIYVFAHEKGWISRILQWRWLVFLGEVSFSFYMIHQLVFGYFWGLLHLSPPPLIGYVSVLVITLVASSMMYKFYEIPLRNKIRSLSGRIENMIRSLKQKEEDREWIQT